MREDRHPFLCRRGRHFFQHRDVFFVDFGIPRGKGGGRETENAVLPTRQPRHLLSLFVKMNHRNHVLYEGRDVLVGLEETEAERLLSLRVARQQVPREIGTEGPVVPPMPRVGVSVGTIEKRKAHTGANGVHGPDVGMREARQHNRFSRRHVGDDDVEPGNILQQNVLGDQQGDDALQLRRQGEAVVEPPRCLKRKEIPYVHISEFVKFCRENHWVNRGGAQANREHRGQKGPRRRAPILADILEQPRRFQVDESLCEQDTARTAARKKQTPKGHSLRRTQEGIRAFQRKENRVPLQDVALLVAPESSSVATLHGRGPARRHPHPHLQYGADTDLQ